MTLDEALDALRAWRDDETRLEMPIEEICAVLDAAVGDAVRVARDAYISAALAADDYRLACAARWGMVRTFTNVEWQEDQRLEEDRERAWRAFRLAQQDGKGQRDGYVE